MAMATAAAASGGPGWTDILTAVGTVGAVVAALGIALFTDWRAGRRIAAEHERSDRALREERALVLEREQLAEAYAVQVAVAVVRRAPDREANPYMDAGDYAEAPVAVVVNRGRYAITGVEARFWYPGTGHVKEGSPPQRVSSATSVPAALADGILLRHDDLLATVLTPWDAGARFIGDFGEHGYQVESYPVVRWSDRWAVRWEHRLGDVRRIRDDEPWEP